jgi:cyanophycinase-like exopeptidase
MSIASYKSNERATPYEAEQALQKLREANFVLIGPGSPTYAIRQWQQTPIPEILIKRVEEGGCLVAASAAVLTVGRFTLPVYEIYKVGEDLHWVEGMNILEKIFIGWKG